MLCGVFLSSSTIITFVFNDDGRVRTAAEVWKVLEFNGDIFKALKSLDNDHRYRKVWKND